MYLQEKLPVFQDYKNSIHFKNFANYKNYNSTNTSFIIYEKFQMEKI